METPTRRINEPFIYRPRTIPEWNYWEEEGNRKEAADVTKIVIGELQSFGNKKISTSDLGVDLASCFPNLTHLHLWGLRNLSFLPPLPTGLKELDLRHCENLESLPELPAGLEVLIIGNASKLLTLNLGQCGPCLWDVAITDCPALAEGSLQKLLGASPNLKALDLSGSSIVQSQLTLPKALTSCRLNRTVLKKGLSSLPQNLRRLDLNGSELEELPTFHGRIEYVDLRKTRFLKRLPSDLGKPLTLMMGQSILSKVLPDELFGDTEEFNSAPLLLAHFEKPRTVDNEVKVILLGNGRAGKSSLARRLTGDRFRRKEKTTHGIRLWTFQMEFEPIDNPGNKESVTVNVWDFAGQDLYHHSHRIFYQSKAIFVICDNTAGAGADPDGDRTDDDELPEGWDTSRSLLYWREQIESLSPVYGSDGAPPILVVRTKADRDGEVAEGRRKQEFIDKCGATLEGLKQIDFGARSRKGLAQLKRLLKEMISKELGVLGKREIRKDALEVKTVIRTLMQQNASVYKATESSPGFAKPPHPLMTQLDFSNLVATHCADTVYAKRPDYLLKQWHWSGFLYWQPTLCGDIVLDQRWVIQGIYAALDRKTCWPRLLAKHGRFIPDDLAEWGWNEAGYSAEKQSLFLGVMESCGMIFPFGERLGQTEYIMLNALQERSPNTERLAADYRGGSKATIEVSLKDKDLSRDRVLALLAHLGKHWQRCGLFWLYGGQIESYCNQSGMHTRTQSFVYLDWMPESENSYHGTLVVRLYGKEIEFFHGVLSECQRILGLEVAGFLSLEEREQFLKSDAEDPNAPGRFDLLSRKPDDFQADCIEIGISFAGDSPDHIDLIDLPEDSIERWPRELTGRLKSFGFRVDQYRIEQKSSDIDQTVDRINYLDALTDRDFMIAFISWEYLESPWCMYEFLRIWQAQGEGKEQNQGKSKVAAFPDAYFSQSALSLKHVKKFKKYWKKWYRSATARIRDDVAENINKTLYDCSNRAEVFGFVGWHKFMSDPSNLDKIVNALSSSKWNIHKVDFKPNEKILEEWGARITETFSNSNHLMDLVIQSWNRKQFFRAQRIYIQAMQRIYPGTRDFREGLLLRTETDEVLKLVCDSILGKLQRLESQQRHFASWKELANAVAPITDSKFFTNIRPS